MPIWMNTRCGKQNITDTSRVHGFVTLKWYDIWFLQDNSWTMFIPMFSHAPGTLHLHASRGPPSLTTRIAYSWLPVNFLVPEHLSTLGTFLKVKDTSLDGWVLPSLDLQDPGMSLLAFRNRCTSWTRPHLVHLVHRIVGALRMLRIHTSIHKILYPRTGCLVEFEISSISEQSFGRIQSPGMLSWH